MQFTLKPLFSALCLILMATATLGDDDASCPWQLDTGTWRLQDETGYSATVDWQRVEGNALIGRWVYPDRTATSLYGWRSDERTLVTIGYRSDGSHWRIEFDSVARTRLKGTIQDVSADGTVSTGEHEVKKVDSGKLDLVFRWPQTDGTIKVVHGSFTRINDGKSEPSNAPKSPN